jgi:ATP-dependent RNA helicase MSS116
MAPPLPPKRKWHPRKATNANGSASNASTAPGTPTTPRSTMAQQPKRPRVEQAAPAAEGTIGVMNVKQMYSTSAGGGEAKPFSTLSGKLDKALLDGMDKMGFEYALDTAHHVDTHAD